MDQKTWGNRLRNRSDMVTRVTHLTRGSSEDTAFNTLCKILIDKKLFASNNKGINVGGAKVCCFQEIPLMSISENLQIEEEIGCAGERYSPFGLRFSKGTLFQKGGRPVIYGDSEELKKALPSSEHWRIVKMDLTDAEKIVDWSHEREWRVVGDYSFDYSEIEIIVATPIYYRELIDWCLSNSHEDILQQINGIVVLNSIIN